MKEIILTSSVMILVLVGLRALFRDKVSRRLIYGMWLLVALRLLIPVQFGSFQFSILNRTEPVTEAITEIAQNPVAGPSREEVYQEVVKDHIASGRPIFIPEVQVQVDQQLAQGDQSPEEIYQQILEANKGTDIVLPDAQEELEKDVKNAITVPTVGQVALIIWAVGVAAMAGWFIGINVSFHQNRKRTAKKVEIPGCPVPVMVDEALPSPCLFGVIKPTIYLTPACAADTQMRRHVLAHELTHLRHRDHIWSWLRCLCLCLFWFHPLVWVAAGMSKRDCELACDEAVLKELGDEERIAYGKTLVDMVAQSILPSRFLETATAMHETKEQLKERVNCIVKKPKVFVTAMVCLILVAVVITGCAFTGALKPGVAEEPVVQLTVDEQIRTVFYNTVLTRFERDTYTVEDLSVRYRGQFGDLYVVYVDRSYLEFSSSSFAGEVVGPVHIKYPDLQQLYVFHQDRFYTLKGAYGEGLISDDQLKQLAEYHNNATKESQITPNFAVECNHRLDPDKKLTLVDQIRKAYFDSYVEDWVKQLYTFHDLTLRFRGQCSDLYVMLVDEPGVEYNAMETVETIGGVEIHYHNGRRLIAYHQGGFYTLQEAYDAKLLKEDSLKKLAEFHNKAVSTDQIVVDYYAACKHGENADPEPEDPNKIYELLPDIPVVTTPCEKPTVLNGETLVTELYNHSISWEDSRGNQFTATVRLPAILPFSDGAIEINESIRSFFQYRIEALRRDYTGKYSSSAKEIDYTVFFSGNYLSICITWKQYEENEYEYVWVLDVSTGKQVSTAELAKEYLGISYPAFLQRCTKNLIAYYQENPWGIPEDQEELMKRLPNDTGVMSSHALYVDNDGKLMHTFHVYDTDQSFNQLFSVLDAYGWKGTDEEGYHWLFHLTTDGTYAEDWARLLMQSFFYAPEEFAQMLAQEDDTVIRHVADSIDYALYQDAWRNQYGSLCIAVRDGAKDAKVAAAAQALLDALILEEPISSWPIAVDNETLNALKKLFADDNSWYARAATSQYEDVQELNLYKAFRESAGSYKDFTDAEQAFLKNTALGKEIGYLDIVKLSAKDMDAVLRQYFGTTLAETNKVGVNNMVYFDNTDSYYCVSNDAEAVPLVVMGVYRQGDGTIAVYYDKETAEGTGDYIMVLKTTNDGYQILSNQKA